MVGTDPAFAGVVGKISQPCALVKRSNGIGAQGTEAHRRDVKDRRHVGIARVASPDRNSKAVGISQGLWLGGMRNEFVAVLVDVSQGSKWTVANLVLRAGVD